MDIVCSREQHVSVGDRVRSPRLMARSSSSRLSEVIRDRTVKTSNRRNAARRHAQVLAGWNGLTPSSRAADMTEDGCVQAIPHLVVPTRLAYDSSLKSRMLVERYGLMKVERQLQVEVRKQAESRYYVINLFLSPELAQSGRHEP